MRVCNRPHGQQRLCAYARHELPSEAPAPAAIAPAHETHRCWRVYRATRICRQLRSHVCRQLLSRAVKEVHSFNRWPAPPPDTFLRCWQPELDARLAAVRELAAACSNTASTSRRLQGSTGLHGRTRRLAAADADADGDARSMQHPAVGSPDSYEEQDEDLEDEMKTLREFALVDATPEYLFNAWSPARIKAAAPHARFVLVLRVRRRHRPPLVLQTRLDHMCMRCVHRSQDCVAL